MERKVINGVYNEPQDITPIGTVLVDDDGKLEKYKSCNVGIAFIEWETVKIRCTKYAYIKE